MIAVKILWIICRFAIAMAPFMHMAYDGKLSIGMWIGSLFWAPIAMALLFQPSDFKYSKRSGRRSKTVFFNHVASPLDEDYLIHEPTVFPKQK